MTCEKVVFNGEFDKCGNCCDVYENTEDAYATFCEIAKVPKG